MNNQQLSDLSVMALPTNTSQTKGATLSKFGADVPRLDFQLPTNLEAGEPPEARGLSRDEVRLMASHYTTNKIFHTQFRSISDLLNPGDVLVINTSGTLNAAIQAKRADDTALELHVSTRLPGNLWLVELRRPDTNKTYPFYNAKIGETLSLNGGGMATLYGPYYTDRPLTSETKARLWVASLDLPVPVEHYLARYGFPIRYHYVSDPWPTDYYQTVYATEMGSAEMPSAGRAFTAELLTQLTSRGIFIAPLILHTGVASLESHEPPYEEFYRVPTETAELINLTKKLKRRVIAVGTTAVRALETVVDTSGIVHPGEGWTNLVITPDHPCKAVDGMLTGLHEPEATHLAMLEALAGRTHLRLTYEEALQEKYLWHEFGDLHLILP